MTFVILTAGIDLSVGSILGLVAITFAATMGSGVPWPLAIGAALLVGGGMRAPSTGWGSPRAASSRSS